MLFYLLIGWLLVYLAGSYCGCQWSAVLPENVTRNYFIYFGNIYFKKGHPRIFCTELFMISTGDQSPRNKDYKKSVAIES